MFEVTRWSEPEQTQEPKFIVGVDLGQAVDYTALCVIEKLERPTSGAVYHVRRIERKLGTPYPQIVSRVRTVMARLPNAELVVDATGVGQPVVDMFNQAGLRPISIHIHGGAKAAAASDAALFGFLQGSQPKAQIERVVNPGSAQGSFAVPSSWDTSSTLQAPQAGSYVIGSDHDTAQMLGKLTQNQLMYCNIILRQILVH